jgi:succinate dehydrogenase / fumarate reductase, cytochrome b subunit
MRWLISTFTSSVGKKLMMALTGLGFCGFLGVHLAGNLSLYAGADAFNSYAKHLHSLGPLITIAELGLLGMAVVHVLTGLTLFWQNLRARPSRYAVDRRAGGRTLGSATMPYTGIVLIIFVLWHLTDFHFIEKGGTTIFTIVSNALAKPSLAIFYVACMIVAAIHVSHGLWSAFQTIGLNHPKYTPIIKGAGLIFSLVVGFGFGLIPIYFLFV